MSTPDFSEGEHPWNCLSCRSKKLRCDRQRPSCSNCVKKQRDCVFPTSGRAFRRAPSHAGRSNAGARQAELLERLRRLETAVDGLNWEVETGRGEPVHMFPDMTMAAATPNNPGLDTRNHGVGASSPPLTEARDNRKPVIVPTTDSHMRGGIYVEDTFWATLRREVCYIECQVVCHSAG